MCGPESRDVCKKDEELEMNSIIQVTKWVRWEMSSVSTFPSGCFFNALITGRWFPSLLHKSTSSSSSSSPLPPLEHPPPPPLPHLAPRLLTGSFSAMETPDGLAFSPQTRSRRPPTWPGATLTSQYLTRRVARQMSLRLIQRTWLASSRTGGARTPAQLQCDRGKRGIKFGLWFYLELFLQLLTPNIL